MRSDFSLKANVTLEKQDNNTTCTYSTMASEPAQSSLLWAILHALGLYTVLLVNQMAK